MKTITLLNDQEFMMSICGGQKKKWHKKPTKKYHGGSSLTNFNRSFNTLKLAIVVPIALNFQINTGAGAQTNSSVITQSISLAL